MCIAFDRQNEACRCRESESQWIVESGKQNISSGVGCTLSRARWQGHAERRRVETLTENVGGHEVVTG